MNNRKRLQGGTVQGHTDIARHSIEAMKQKLGRNIHGLKEYGIVQKDKTPSGSTPLASMAYSCVFWAEHLCFDEDGDLRQLTEGSEDVQVLQFLEQRFLNWLESLSLLGGVLDGIKSIRKLLQATQSDKSPQLAEFLKDAEKFVLGNGWIIDSAPLQLYGSALVFSPTMSKIREHFWEDRWPFIKDVKGVKEHWDPFRQTLQADKYCIFSLAFSPDSATLASVSDDGALRLWDAVTGVQKWMRHSPSSILHECIPDDSRPVIFSSDGRTLVSVSYEDDVSFWDVGTGTRQQAFEGCGTRNCLSRDGALLASVQYFSKTSNSRDKEENIVLRDAYTGTIKHTLTHHGKVTRLAFCTNLNCDCKLLATASLDSNVKIWDTDSGKTKRTIEHPFESTPLMAFSPDNRTIALAFRTETWIYDYVTGIHKHMLRSPLHTFEAVTFSPDGKTLVLGKSHGEIKLWDATNLNKAETLKQSKTAPYRGDFNPVVVSPSCSTIASMSYDKIQLLDTTKGSSKKTLNAQGSLRQIAFSQDNTTLVSISFGKLQFWDVIDGTCRKTIDTWSQSTVMSPDGTIVASPTVQWTITLWNTATLDHKQLQLRSPNVGLIAFSPDSTKLASVKADRLEIWNIAGDEPSRIFELSKGFGDCDSIAFSPDGENIIWASTQKVEILDPATNNTKEFEIQKPDMTAAIVRYWLSKPTVGLLALSADCNTLALSWTSANTVQVRDTAKFSIKYTFDMNCNIYELSFSDDGSFLNTNRGVLGISDGTNSLFPPSNSTALFVQSEWIVGGSGPLLWIPPDHRGDGVNVFNDVITLGNRWDDTVVLEIDMASDGRGGNSSFYSGLI